MPPRPRRPAEANLPHRSHCPKCGCFTALVQLSNGEWACPPCKAKATT